MEKAEIARRLILQYIESCCASDPAHHDELEVSLECLKTVWGIENINVPIPGVNSIVDLIPSPKYDAERAMELKLEGNQALKAGNDDLAIEKYTDAIKLDPTNAQFYCNRAAAHYNKKDYELSIKDAEKAISLDPKYATAYSRLGSAYYSLGRLSDARTAYKRGLQACPDSEPLKERLRDMGPEEPKEKKPFTAPGGNPANLFQNLMGSFATNPDLLSQLSSKVNSPEVQELLADPEMAELYEQIQANPSAIFSMMGDPRVMRLFSAFTGGSK